MVTLSSTASTRIGFGFRSGKRTAAGSTGECRSIHVDVNRIAEQSTDERRNAMKLVVPAHPDERQHIDRLGGGGQLQGVGIESDRQIGAGANRGGRPVGLADVD